MLQENGIPTAEDLAKVMPPAERLAKGPCAILECFQKIPCNPCATSCPLGAIERGNDINELPVIHWEKCSGCAVCVANCPGLAIFVIDLSQPDRAVVKLPYEFLPLPAVDEVVTALGRDGAALGEAKVLRVQDSKAQDRTRLVWLEVEKQLAMQVRNFRRKEAVKS
ncbi:MAG: 4Fe-4S binding protein [Negativicutes bacterium]|nr:4Fe-4S binding protein [Negativicutes bacterium]